MQKIKNILTILLLTIISGPIFALHSVKLPDGKVLKIIVSEIMPDLLQPFLVRYLKDSKKIDHTFEDTRSIPMNGSPKDFKIILLASGNIMVNDPKAIESVIFDKDGKLLHNVEDVQRMIAEKQYNIAGIDKKQLLLALFEAARFQDFHLLLMGYQLTDEDVQTLLAQRDIKDVAGRILNINISGDVCDLSAYNKANGANVAEGVIESIR
jgi:hypothetical protein